MAQHNGGRVRVERGIYRQPNGNYAVCFMVDGRPRFRTVGTNLEAARAARQALIDAARRGSVPVAPQLRFATVASWWLRRFEAKVAAGERRERTLEAHRYHLDHHLLPAFGPRLIRTIAVDDIAWLITVMRAGCCSEKTAAGALASLHSILRYALRHGWIVADPVAKLEPDERPRPVLGTSACSAARRSNACSPRASRSTGR